MAKLREDFDLAADKFQFVLEYDDLYQSAELYARGMSFLEQILRENISSTAKLNIKLGMAYMKRSRPSERAEAIFKDVDNIAAQAKGNRELEIKSRIVRGGIYLMKSRDYERAREEFESLYALIRHSNNHFLYGLVARSLGAAYMYLGEQVRAEAAFQDALATFRRFDYKVSTAIAFNDFAVLKKQMCQYDEAEKLLKQSVKLFKKLSLYRYQIYAYNNLGIINIKTGNWSSAEHYFLKALEQRELIMNADNPSCQGIDAFLYMFCDSNLEHLLLLKRDFVSARRRLDELLEKYKPFDTTYRMQALTHEFLGELHTETGDYEQAEKHLQNAYDITAKILPQSDVMTEVKRRQAQLSLCKGEPEKAKKTAIECIRLCKKIDDKHELGAVLRILGEVYESMGAIKKAAACFETAIQTLKGIHECYELMRSCISYGAFLVAQKEADAEIYLMDARQHCKKLEIDYYLARINILLAKHAANNENFAEARDHMLKAEEIYEELQPCDQKTIKPLIVRANKELDQQILHKSMTAAEELKTICRVYEEARFPMEDIKPDLAYQVAQTVGAESLFLVKKRGRGYAVPLTYNITVREAKNIIRRLDRGSQKNLLGINKDPRIFEIPHNGKSLVCVPSHSKSAFVLCTQVAEQMAVSPRQFEFLIASAEVLERLADDNVEQQPVVNGDFITEDADSRESPKHPRGSFKDILTVDPGMIKTIRLAERASLSDAPILLEGDTGVGKELFAKAIHENSRRKSQPFVAINAGGMPVNFLESQLFGHVRGAYTDAVVDRVGLLEEARGGSVFFDEVGEMGEELQVKLLRLLENGEFRRLGENQVRVADVRMISATNRDLLKQVERNEFRRDLYYRLGAVKLSIPPLRFRQRDIELLIRHFLKECTLRNGQPHRHFEIDVKAIEALELYNWPGNIRELQNEITRIVSLIGESELIRFGMLSESIKDYLKTKNRSEGILEQSVERYERRLILDALNKNDWNRLRTAEEIGLPRTTLLAKMKRLNIATR